MFAKILNSAKSGGLAYFFVGVIVITVSLLVPLYMGEAYSSLLPLAWITSSAISLIIIVPFFVWFTAFTERWGWKLKNISSWKDSLILITCWSVPGVLFGGLSVYLIFSLL